MSAKVLKWIGLLSLTAVCGLKQAAAQAPWATIGGAEYFDKATDLTTIADTNYLITVNGSDTAVSGFTLVKLDEQGEIIWENEADYSSAEEVPLNIAVNTSGTRAFITGYVDVNQHLRVVEFDMATGEILSNSDSWSDGTEPFTGLSARVFTDNLDSVLVFAASGNTLYRYAMDALDDLSTTHNYTFPNATLNEQVAISASAKFNNQIQIIAGTTQLNLRPYIWAFNETDSLYYNHLTADSILINGLNVQDNEYVQLSGNTHDSTNLYVALFDTTGGFFNLIIDTTYIDPGYKIIGGDMVRLSDGNYALNAVINPGTPFAKTVRYYINETAAIIAEIPLLDDEIGVELPLLTVHELDDRLISAGTIITPLDAAQEYIVTSGPSYSELPACALDCVWPGDADNNGIVDMTDLFPLGIKYASSGTPRDSISDAWIGNKVIEWPSEIYVGLNSKYADCFGDGNINESDVNVIYENYTLEHVVNNYRLGEDGFPLWLNTAGLTLVPGYNEIPIMLGTELIPVDAIIGLEFNVRYEGPPIIDSTSLSIVFNESWLGHDTSLIKMYYNFPLTHQIDAGAVNIEYENKSGYGEIGRMGFIVEDNIAGILVEYGDSSVIFNVSSATGIKYDYSPVALSVSSYEVLVGISNVLGQEDATFIYPNPATSSITINLPDYHHAVVVKLYDLNGKLIADYALQNNAQQCNINIQNLATGMYVIKLYDLQSNQIIGFDKLIKY